MYNAVIIIFILVVAVLVFRYLRDCAEGNSKNIIDVVFLTVLFVSICIPCIKINKSNFLKTENRSLTEMPHIIDSNNKINNFYGKYFEDYIKDRFFLREELIKSYYYTIGDINDIIYINRTTYNKKNKRMLMHFKHYKIGYDNNNHLLTEIVDNFNLLNDFCKANGIRLYILIVPSTEDVTHEYAPYRLGKYNQTKKLFVQNVQKQSIPPVIFPLDAILEEAKNAPVTFKTDIHWTENSAFAGYRELMKEINKDYPSVQILNDDDFYITKNNKVRSDWNRCYHNGELLKNIHKYCRDCEKRLLDTDYLYYDHKKKNLRQTKIVNIPYLREKSFYYPEGADLRVLMIGTSMNENLTEFIPFTFKNVKYIRLNSVIQQKNDDEFKIIKYHKDRILDYKPDIMIFCITTGNLFSIKNLFVSD